MSHLLQKPCSIIAPGRRLFWRILLPCMLLMLMMSLAACGSEEDEAPQEGTVPARIETPTPAPARGGTPTPAPARGRTSTPVSVKSGTPTPVPAKSETAASVPAAQGAADTWLVMLYQDADDETLEQDIFIDLNEAEIVGSTDEVTIVAQLDRLDGGFDGGDDETGAKRYLVTRDSDLETIGSEELKDLGEVDMGNWETLVDFAVWAIQSYPMEKTVLILSDHGMGWLGGWSDDDPNEGSQMSMADIDRALEEIIQRTGIGQFELMGFDACLMAQVESLTAITPHARYAVASEETEPALGWAYASFLGALAQNPAMSGADLARTIVDSYIEKDFRVVDDEARRVFAEENLDSEGEPTAEEVAAELGLDVTLTAVDLSQMSALNAALNDLALALAADDPEVPAAARAYAQSYEDVFGKEKEPSYVDLGHFAALVAEESNDQDVVAAAEALTAQIERAVLREKHGKQRPGSSGFSVYFPDSELYSETYMGELGDYPTGASRFAAASLWDDFLTSFYTGSEIDPAGADLAVLEPAFPVPDLAALARSSQPAAKVTTSAPAAGDITVEPLEISADEISAAGAATLRTTVRGKNVAFIYIYTLYYNEDDDSYLTADVDFIAADAVKQVGGVTYPDWGDSGEIPIEIDWEPTVYFLSDGNEENDQFALFMPKVYGATSEEDVYTVNGLYAFGGKGKSREATIRFDGNGEMRSVWVFSGSEQTGAPRQVTPKPGDTFTVWDEWQEYDEQAEDWVYNYYEGGVMTFGRRPLTMQPYYAFPGAYMVGIVAEDYDGNLVEEYVEISVTE